MKRALIETAIYSAAALVLLATFASATPWTVPDGEGGWKPNPECSSANCHETGDPDPEEPEPPTEPPITEPEPPTPPVNPDPPAKPSEPKPDFQHRGGNGRDPVTYPGVTAFKTCCVHEGQRYATTRLFRSKRAASEACAAVIDPPSCFPLTDQTITGPLK